MATTKLMTVEEFEQLALDGRYELIDGEVVEMPPSGGVSSSSGVRISTHLSNHVAPRSLGTVYGADGGFVLFPDRQMVRVPDVAFVRAERLPATVDQDGFLRLAPDLAVEVLSPSDRRAEVEANPSQWHDYLQEPDDYREWLHDFGLTVEYAEESERLTIRIADVEDYLRYKLAWTYRWEEVRAMDAQTRVAFYTAVCARMDEFAEPDGSLLWRPALIRVTARRESE